MRIRHSYILLSICGVLFYTGCIEEIEIETESFENALVIDAIITNEDKQHEVFLSRTYPFEDGGTNPESNANVTITGNGTIYEFEEDDAGRYVSKTSFRAVPNVDYQLQISTNNGRTYNSSLMRLTPIAQIDALYAIRETNDDGTNGMSMYVDTYDPTGNSKYYRYEYEETFKVQPPSFVNQDLIRIILPQDPFNDCYICSVKLVVRSEDKRICYRTETSQNINLTNTNDFTEDRVSRYLTHFVRSDDYKISHRYSLLVKQYVHSGEVYNYLDALSNFSEEGSLFSQVQPGFIASNLVSETNLNEKVIGFFEAASVSTKRIFFNYDDFYPNEPLPPYINSCQPSAPLRCVPENFNTVRCGGLMNGIDRNIIVYRGMNTGQIPRGGAYLMVDRECGDCTALGDIEPPEFWIK